MRKFVGGALPPPGREWEIGKTAASIKYVHSGERILAEGKLSTNTAQKLRDKIEQIKRGEYVVQSYLTDQQIVGESL